MSYLISRFSHGQLSIPRTRFCMTGACRFAIETKAELKECHK